MWWVVAIFVGMLVLSFAFAPKPQTTPPAGLSEIQAPTAEVGREIGVLFGTRDINGPNFTWFGHLKTKAIKSSGGKK